MSDNAIDVKNVKVSYRTVDKLSVRSSLFKLKKSKVEVHEALKGVTFSLKEGEILGIVGKNGSGKSTLLRTLAGIFSPDAGDINTHGHTMSLLSIGVGFQKKLTGRENIVLSGMLLGFSEKEVLEKMPDIIAFSGLEKFIDRPVRTYSSGMYSKLAFSITAILETDIILIDEVLSVGDGRFKKKSFRKMKSLIQDDNRTVVIVSHSIESIRKLCTKVLWLDDGEVIMIGDTEEVLGKYEAFIEEE